MYSMRYNSGGMNLEKGDDTCIEVLRLAHAPPPKDLTAYNNYTERLSEFDRPRAAKLLVQLQNTHDPAVSREINFINRGEMSNTNYSQMTLEEFLANEVDDVESYDVSRMKRLALVFYRVYLLGVIRKLQGNKNKDFLQRLNETLSDYAAEITEAVATKGPCRVLDDYTPLLAQVFKLSNIVVDDMPSFDSEEETTQEIAHKVIHELAPSTQLVVANGADADIVAIDVPGEIIEPTVIIQKDGLVKQIVKRITHAKKPNGKIVKTTITSEKIIGWNQ